jgi:hypothetical protein
MQTSMSSGHKENIRRHLFGRIVVLTIQPEIDAYDFFTLMSLQVYGSSTKRPVIIKSESAVHDFW